jgi:mRNA interferase RelE/StbE/toxin YoeB
LEASPEFEEDYAGKCRKNKAFRNAVDKKITQIQENPLHYKPLQAPMQGVRRVHVQTSFVLLFEVMEDTKTVRLIALKHHDEAYE